MFHRMLWQLMQEGSAEINYAVWTIKQRCGLRTVTDVQIWSYTGYLMPTDNIWPSFTFSLFDKIIKSHSQVSLLYNTTYNSVEGYVWTILYIYIILGVCFFPTCSTCGGENRMIVRCAETVKVIDHGAFCRQRVASIVSVVSAPCRPIVFAVLARRHRRNFR